MRANAHRYALVAGVDPLVIHDLVDDAPRDAGGVLIAPGASTATARIGLAGTVAAGAQNQPSAVGQKVVVSEPQAYTRFRQVERPHAQKNPAVGQRTDRPPTS